MARKKSSRRHWYSRKGKSRKRPTQIPIAIVAGVAGTLLGGHCDPGDTTLACIQRGDPYAAIDRLITNVTGYSMTHAAWDWHWIAWEPVVGGVIVHKLASIAGVNRLTKRVPMIGKYIGV